MSFWDTITDAFSRDGTVTKICEKIPIVGHVTAGVQYIAGNEEHAKRALAASTGSLVTTGGAVVGFMVGGPPGAVVGAAVASQAGIAAEYGISTTIKDQNVKGDVGEVSIKRCITDGILSAGTGLVGGGTGLAAGKVVGSAISTGVVTGLGQVSKNPLGSNLPPGKADTPGPEVDSDTEDEKKKRRRVITRGQAQKAEEISDQCVALAKRYPVSPLGDLVLNLSMIKHGIVENADWESLNKDYQSLVQDYILKQVDKEARAIQELEENGYGIVAPDVQNALKAIEDDMKELSRRMETEVKYRYS